jgi:hypothetical protein
VSKAGYKLSVAFVDADLRAAWRGSLAELRPAMATEIGQPRMVQLTLL